MVTRIITITVLIASLTLMLAACDTPPASTKPPIATPASALSSGTPTPTPAATPTTAPTATPTVAPTATPSGMAEIPPCTPVPGSSVDPCKAGRGLFNATSGSMTALLADPPAVPYSVGDHLDGLGWSTFEVVHIVVRGTYLPGTVRCTSGNSFRVPSHLELSPDEPPDILIDLLQIYCYADVRVNAYIVGTGPSVLTAIVAFDNYGFHGISEYGPAEVETLQATWEIALIEGGEQLRRPHVVTGPSGGITGPRGHPVPRPVIERLRRGMAGLRKMGRPAAGRRGGGRRPS